jgi:hypothetical protein
MNTLPETREPSQHGKILDFEKFLPYGETLRGYLRQSFVKLADLSELLRSRGVFVQSAEKEDLVALLTTTLISPSEFQTLLDCRKERDLREKIIERTRAWKSNRSLRDAANAVVDLEKLDFESTEKCKLVGKPTIVPINGHSEYIEVKFTVLRTRKSLDWSDEETQFSGKVTLKKVEVAGQVILTITHTSPETKEIAEKYAKLIEDSLQASDDIGEPSSEDQILYSTFDNIQRADFLLSLTGGCSHGELKFVRLVNLEALTDTTQKIPENCRDLIEGFEQLRLKGELHKSAYCRKRELYPFVRFYRMDARFTFKVVGAEGECLVRYEFSGYGTSENPNAEFTHEIEGWDPADKFKHVSKASVQKSLQELISRVVAQKFKERARAINPQLGVTSQITTQEPTPVPGLPATATAITPAVPRS